MLLSTYVYNIKRVMIDEDCKRLRFSCERLCALQVFVLLGCMAVLRT